MSKEDEIKLISNELIKSFRNFMIADRHWWRSNNFAFTYIRRRHRYQYDRCYRALLRRGMNGVAIRGLTFNLEF